MTSEMIKELIGKKVTVFTVASYNNGVVTMVDDEFIKIEKRNKKGALTATYMVKIDMIMSVTITE